VRGKRLAVFIGVRKKVSSSRKAAGRLGLRSSKPFVLSTAFLPCSLLIYSFSCIIMPNRARGVEVLTATPHSRERRWPGQHIQPRDQAHENDSKRKLYLKLAGPFLLTLCPIFGPPIVCCSFCFLVAKRPHRSGPSCGGIGVIVGSMYVQSSNPAGLRGVQKLILKRGYRLAIVSILTFIVTGWPVYHRDGWKMSGKILENYIAVAIFSGISVVEATGKSIFFSSPCLLSILLLSGEMLTKFPLDSHLLLAVHGGHLAGVSP